MHPYETLFLEGFAHQIRMLQNRSALQREVIRLVHEIEGRWRDRLIGAGAALTGADINRIRSAQFSGSERIRRFSRLLNVFVAELTNAMQELLTERLRDVAAFEGMFWGDRYQSFLGEVPELALDLNMNTTRAARSNVVRGAIVAATLVQGFRRYRRNRAERLRNAVANGAQTDGQSGITSLFRVSRRNRARGRIFGETTRSLVGLVQTSYTHAQSSGVQAIVEQNDFLDSVWTAMMDNRRPGIDEKTSDICISRNGMLVNRDLGGQIPPAHINCRSVIFPQIDPRMLSRAQKRALDSETRAALQQGLPDMGTATQAFNALSRAQQIELLGPTRFRLFRQGELQFPRDFINPREERRYTLEEIARREGFDDISELLNRTDGS